MSCSSPSTPCAPTISVPTATAAPRARRSTRLAARGALFENAFTHWPKTRGSLAIMLTGRRPSQNGYSKSHPGIAGFNATIASTLAAAGYDTAAVVDNPNVAREHGYAKGFASYTQTWDDAALTSEWARTRAITDGALRYLQSPRDAAFLPLAALREPACSVHSAVAVRQPLRGRGRRRRSGAAGGREFPRRHPAPVGTAGPRTGSATTWRSTTARLLRSIRRSAGCSRRCTLPAARRTRWCCSRPTTARALASTATTSTTARTCSSPRCASR